MPRTKSAHFSTITLPSSGQLTFQIPPDPSARTSISLPPGCKFDSDLHWHELHDEFFQVTQGVIKLVLENSAGVLQTFYIGKSSDPVHVMRGRRHRLRRGDEGSGYQASMENLLFRDGTNIQREDWEAEVKAEEWTSPGDGQKEMFFRNLAGVVAEKRSGGTLEDTLLTINVFMILREYDNWPAFLGGRLRRLEWIASHVVLWAVSFLGVLLGMKGTYDEYSPSELRGSKKKLA